VLSVIERGIPQCILHTKNSTAINLTENMAGQNSVGERNSHTDDYDPPPDIKVQMVHFDVHTILRNIYKYVNTFKPYVCLRNVLEVQLFTSQKTPRACFSDINTILRIVHGETKLALIPRIILNTCIHCKIPSNVKADGAYGNQHALKGY
jgi:hypothetical protein